MHLKILYEERICMRKTKLLNKLVAFSLSMVILASYIPANTIYALSDINTSAADYRISETEDVAFINGAVDSGYRASKCIL